MNMIEIITKKKLGQALNREEIVHFTRGAADGSIPDYQLAALLMAIRLNGMNAEETACLTMAMAESGNMLVPEVNGMPVDKHSTGGVGDTTTLVLAPLVAACGGKVLKMSGRGLGHSFDHRFAHCHYRRRRALSTAQEETLKKTNAPSKGCFS